MGQTQQMVKAAHRLPVMRKKMLVTITTAFFGVMTVLDPPTKARTKIGTFMHVLYSERPAGNPGVTTGFGFNFRGIAVHLFPLFLTNNHMNRKYFLFAIGSFKGV